MSNPVKSFLLSLFTLPLLLAPVGAKTPSRSGDVKAEAGPGLADYVNPFIGTSGPDSGCTFPGVTSPFGMVQWSPDTVGALQDESRSGTYVYADDGIQGFSLNHLSGVGCPVMGDVPIMPVIGPITSSPATHPAVYRAKFSHNHERASPGFYAVGLNNGVKVQLTVTTRAGMGRFTFPASAHSAILFDMGRNSGGVSDASIEIVDDQKISGSVSSGGFCGGPNKYTVYFAGEFSRPFARFGTWKDSTLNRGQRTERGPHTGGFVEFDTMKDQVVQMKIALSYVSTNNARKNLHTEIAGWDFDAVRKSAHDRWSRELGLIEVSGGTDEMNRTFYTALYHVLSVPNVFSDVNGDYRGFDGQVHVAKGRTQYANFSSWDIYRGQVQLLALLHPRETSDMVQSLLADGQQSAGLPVWPVANSDSCMMVGDPACPIIASAYAFGARSYDTQAALKAMVKGATQPELRSKICPQWRTFESYLKLGYLGPDSQSGPSQTLEFTTADFSIAQYAKAVGDATTYQTFMRRAQFWLNIFNHKTGYIEPRRNDGSFITVDPAAPEHYVEGNGAQYTWMVPYNLRSLFDMMGGNDVVVTRLDQFFTELNAGSSRPYSWIGNEPSFAVPWAYDFAGAPWRTQAVVRRIVTELFSSKPEGLPGTDDLGAMSAWYVFATLGLYPGIPGVGGFCLNGPLFPSATFHLGNGRVVSVLGENASATNPYVQSLRLNNAPYTGTWLTFEALSKGATLHFRFGEAPNKAWGSRPEDAPPSFLEGMTVAGR